MRHLLVVLMLIALWGIVTAPDRQESQDRETTLVTLPEGVVAVNGSNFGPALGNITSLAAGGGSSQALEGWIDEFDPRNHGMEDLALLGPEPAFLSAGLDDVDVDVSVPDSLLGIPNALSLGEID